MIRYHWSFRDKNIIFIWFCNVEYGKFSWTEVISLNRDNPSLLWADIYLNNTCHTSNTRKDSLIVQNLHFPQFLALQNFQKISKSSKIWIKWFLIGGLSRRKFHVILIVSGLHRPPIHNGSCSRTFSPRTVRGRRPWKLASGSLPVVGIQKSIFTLFHFSPGGYFWV